MAALISSVMDTKDKVPFFVARCEEMGIEILPPDVNLSDHDFVVVEGKIRFGLDAVKGVGYAAVEAIKRAREDGGEFSSLWDFCERVDNRAVNKKAIEALIKCGAFGTTGDSRKGMLEVLEAAQGAGAQTQQDALIGQGSIFDLGAGGDAGGVEASPFRRPAHPAIPPEEFDQAELLAVEKEAIGLFISAHPLKPLREALRARVDCPLADVSAKRDRDQVTVGGIITEAKKIRTRNGDPMMFATLDDLEGSVEILVFGKALEAYGGELGVDQIVLVRGRVDHKDATRTSVVAQDLERFDPSPEEVEAARSAAAQAALPPDPFCLSVDAARLPASIVDDLKDLLERFPGQAEFVLRMRTSAGERRLRFGAGYRVDANASLRALLQDLARRSCRPGRLRAIARRPSLGTQG